MLVVARFPGRNGHGQGYPFGLDLNVLCETSVCLPENRKMEGGELVSGERERLGDKEKMPSRRRCSQDARQVRLKRRVTKPGDRPNDGLPRFSAQAHSRHIR
jgi:hypothetical protein